MKTNNIKRFATTLKNDLLRSLSPFAMIGETRKVPKTNESPNLGKHPNHKNSATSFDMIYSDVHGREALIEYKLIKRMTNWQNHQWMKARAKKRNISPVKFAQMVRG